MPRAASILIARTPATAVLVGELRDNLYEARLAVRRYLLSGDPADLGKVKVAIGKAEELRAEADKRVDEPGATRQTR